MIDIHSHILPGVDDGPDGWDKSLKMLECAVRDGIKGIIATPHVSPGVYDNPKESVLALTGELRERAKALPIEVYPGSELMVSRESLDGLRDGRYCTLNGSRYILLELPGHFPPDTALDFIFSITSGGLVPILAHPERNPRIQKDIVILYEAVRMGALVQVTSGSLAGIFGGGIKKIAQEIISRRLAHLLASDAHDDTHRAPILSAGLKEASRIMGGRAAATMVRDLPEKVLKNQTFRVAEPLPPKKAFYFF